MCISSQRCLNTCIICLQVGFGLGYGWGWGAIKAFMSMKLCVSVAMRWRTSYSSPNSFLLAFAWMNSGSSKYDAVKIEMSGFLGTSSSPQGSEVASSVPIAAPKAALNLTRNRQTFHGSKFDSWYRNDRDEGHTRQAWSRELQCSEAFATDHFYHPLD